MEEHDKVIIPCLGNKSEVDYLLEKIITTLNEKGYLTKGCCQGHLDKRDEEDLCWGYIKLQEGYFFPYTIVYDESETSGIHPEGYEYGHLEWSFSTEEERTKIISCLENYVESLSNFPLKVMTPRYFSIIYRDDNNDFDTSSKSYIMRGFTGGQVEKMFKWYYPLYSIEEVIPIDTISIVNIIMDNRSKNYKIGFLGK